nr:hypothetical protein BaRGS_015926 [Batillaria attramentaria]
MMVLLVWEPLRCLWTGLGNCAIALLVVVTWSEDLSLGPCTWCSVSGRKVILKPVSILYLTEAERLALQKIALSKLQAMELACPIVIPKDGSELRRHKKRALSIKRRSKSANLASLLDTLSPEKGKDKENKDSRPSGLVFGIPLARCIANDRELAKRRKTQTSALQGRSDSADHLLAPRRTRKSSSSSQGSLDNGAQNGTMTTANPCLLYESARRAASSDSLSESENSSRNTSSSLIDSLSLQAPPGSRGGSQAVGSTPQLRDEFDSGKEVQLTDEHNPHDVGALLKEFFRDLPEPLLTRDLYLPFVATRKIEDRQRQAEAIRLLLTLLPPANRDTLWSLLRFLATVHRHSADTVDSNGKEVHGNKMDSHNLATLFGPNVLHRARATNEKQFMAECAQQAEQSSEVISVTKDMIDNHYELFEISASQRDEVLRLMMEADQENLDRVLRRLANENQIEPDPESMCSVFDESEYCQSLPHSANSDADLLSLARRKGAGHSPLRVSRSADPWTDPPQRSSSTSNPFAEGRRVSSLDNAGERLTDSPSPQDSPHKLLSPRGGNSSSAAATSPRPPLVTVSADSPSPEVVMRSTSGRRRAQEGPVSVSASGSVLASGRPGVLVRERPFSEAYAGSLTIPQPAYMRENSASSASSSYLSSSGGHSSHLGSDSSGHWVLPTPTPPASRGASPQTQRRSVTSAPAGSRRRTTQTSSSRSDDDDGCASPAVGSPEWQRERWRHWELITAGRNGGGEKEQETLV